MYLGSLRVLNMQRATERPRSVSIRVSPISFFVLHKYARLRNDLIRLLNREIHLYEVYENVDDVYSLLSKGCR